MRRVEGDFVLTEVELREVVSFVVGAAEWLLPVYELARPGDVRPSEAIESARVFLGGQWRTKRQRVASLAALAAAREAPTEVARLAAQAAGDAASAAYLHAIAKGHQVGHVLRASANRARVVEIGSGDPAASVASVLDEERERASALVVHVLHRYPPIPMGRSRAAELMSALDAALRQPAARP